MKTIRILPALLLAAMAACSGFKQPKIELDNLELGSLGLTGGTLMVNLRVENPNPVGVRAEDLRYQLFLRAPQDSARSDAWQPVTSGTYNERIEVGARETKTIRIPVEFRYAELGDAVRSVMRTGRVNYRATGTVRVRAAGFSRDVPFSKTGSANVLGR
jgi:LEA14-like dessication related protein